MISNFEKQNRPRVRHDLPVLFVFFLFLEEGGDQGKGGPGRREELEDMIFEYPNSSYLLPRVSDWVEVAHAQNAGFPPACMFRIITKS